MTNHSMGDRGLPHAHILYMLHADDKPRSPDEYDDFISAEIPDKETESELYDTISTSNMHGPCGPDNIDAVCMVEGFCSKHFPKEFCELTKETEGYPEYRRRQDGKTVTKIVRFRGRQHVEEETEGMESVEVSLDNRYVVPYNRALSKKYNAHINVEYCASMKAVKYLYK